MQSLNFVACKPIFLRGFFFFVTMNLLFSLILYGGAKVYNFGNGVNNIPNLEGARK